MSSRPLEATVRPGDWLLGRVGPVVPALVGAACISSSAIVVQLAQTQAGTTAFLRCALALPGLYALALWERRRYGSRSGRDRLMAALAGAFLGADLVLWTHSIYDVGAGIATVLGNLQVLFVAIIAWVVLRERPRTQFLVALPVVLAGVVLLGDVIGHSRGGEHPAAGVLYGLGTSICYAIFILVLRRNTKGLAQIAGPLADATLGAALAALALGLVLGQLSFHMSLAAFGWLALLALVSQTLGWLLITSSLPHLPASISSLLLLLQPAAALLLAAVVLGQQPTLVQLFGVTLVCAGVLITVRSGWSRDTASEPPAG